MSRDPKIPGGRREGGERKPPQSGEDLYGGVWGEEGPRTDTSGRGSAPWAPGSRRPGEKSLAEDDDGPEIAADDAGARARTETPQRKRD